MGIAMTSNRDASSLPLKHFTSTVFVIDGENRVKTTFRSANRSRR